MIKKPTWVIFDIGGVLFDSDSAFRDIASYLDTDKEILTQGIIKFLGKSELGIMSFEEVWKNLLKSLNKHDDHQKVIEIWWDMKRWVSDTKSLIFELKKAGYKLAILTNNWTGMRKRILNDVKEFTLIDKIFESSTEGLRKPDVNFYKFVEKQINAYAGDIYFIDDSNKNIEAAKEIKWLTFLYSLENDHGKKSNALIRKELLS
jgi:epoxide hydrolase-like predicted phosphatase